MALHTNWKNFWWLNVGVMGIWIILLIFLFPETKWHRVHPKEMLQNLQATDEKGVAATHVDPKSSNEPSDLSNAEAQMAALSHAATAERDPYLGKGSPSKQQFKLFQPSKNPFKTIAYDVWVPIKLHAFPIVQLAAFVVSWSASCFLTLNLTQSQVFAVPPYSFSSQSIGFFNWAIFGGAMIGLSTNGYLSDWVSMKATKRNRGVREPEMRLPALIPYVLIMLLGNFVVAFGYQYKWPWEVSQDMHYNPRSCHASILIHFAAVGSCHHRLWVRGLTSCW